MGDSLSRILTWVGAPLACLLLIFLFVLARFPYDRFREVAVTQLASATGARVELGELAGGLSIGGPAVKVRDLLMRWPDGSEQRYELASQRHHGIHRGPR